MNVDGITTIGKLDEEQMPGCMVVVHQARSSRDTLEWMLWGQHELMIELLRGRDSWALVRLRVDHMQFSKSDYLAKDCERGRAPIAKVLMQASSRNANGPDALEGKVSSVLLRTRQAQFHGARRAQGKR